MPSSGCCRALSISNTLGRAKRIERHGGSTSTSSSSHFGFPHFVKCRHAVVRLVPPVTIYSYIYVLPGDKRPSKSWRGRKIYEKVGLVFYSGVQSCLTGCRKFSYIFIYLFIFPSHLNKADGPQRCHPARGH